VAAECRQGIFNMLFHLLASGCDAVQVLQNKKVVLNVQANFGFSLKVPLSDSLLHVEWRLKAFSPFTPSRCSTLSSYF
jgi:hypothetical protein